GEATAVAVVSLWLAYFILVFTFPVIFEKLRDQTFFVYSAICLVGFVFVWLKVKETKGKTLEELENIMSGKW
ncbi:MAG: MFS transporter, partial [Chitinophagaceae bacterium]|nr:MFS transporter [Chitinophagaceae bacterium]